MLSLKQGSSSWYLDQEEDDKDEKNDKGDDDDKAPVAVDMKVKTYITYAQA